MRFVQRAEIRPGRCAVLPQIGGDHPLGFFDCGEMPGFDNRVFVSVVAAEEMARKLGWTPPVERQELEARVAALEGEVDRLGEEVREADRFAEAAEYTLGKFGEKVRRKPGRPKKQHNDEREAA